MNTNRFVERPVLIWRLEILSDDSVLVRHFYKGWFRRTPEDLLQYNAIRENWNLQAVLNLWISRLAVSGNMTADRTWSSEHKHNAMYRCPEQHRLPRYRSRYVFTFPFLLQNKISRSDAPFCCWVKLTVARSDFCQRGLTPNILLFKCSFSSVAAGWLRFLCCFSCAFANNSLSSLSVVSLLCGRWFYPHH